MTYVSENSRFTNINDPIWPRNFDIYFANVKAKKKITFFHCLDILCHIVALIRTLVREMDEGALSLSIFPIKTARATTYYSVGKDNDELPT